MRAGLGGKLTRGQGLGSRGAVAAGAAPPPPSVTQYLDPISNVNALWMSNAYTSIDNGVRQPTVAGISDSVIANKNDDNEGQQWGMALGDAGSYPTLRLWVMGTDTFSANPPLLKARLNINGAWTAQQDMPSQFPSTVQASSWKSLDFSGPFTLPLSTLQVELETQVMDDGTFDQYNIYEIYIEAVPAA